jgi:hypothetical protein
MVIEFRNASQEMWEDDEGMKKKMKEERKSLRMKMDVQTRNENVTSAENVQRTITMSPERSKNKQQNSRKTDSVAKCLCFKEIRIVSRELSSLSLKRCILRLQT